MKHLSLLAALLLCGCEPLTEREFQIERNKLRYSRNPQLRELGRVLDSNDVIMAAIQSNLDECAAIVNGVNQ